MRRQLLITLTLTLTLTRTRTRTRTRTLTLTLTRRVGSQLPERASRISEQVGGKQEQGFVYDDSGTGTAAGLHRGPNQGQSQGKKARAGPEPGRKGPNRLRAREKGRDCSRAGLPRDGSRPPLVRVRVRVRVRVMVRARVRVRVRARIRVKVRVRVAARAG